MSRVIRL